MTGEWNVSEKSLDRSSIRVFNTYGTKRVSAYKIVEDTPNLRDVRVFDNLISQRAALYRQFRTMRVQSDPERKDRVKQEISTLTGQIKKLRKEVALCEDIAQRSEKMRENLRMAREEKENSSPKREEQHRSR